MAKGAHLIDSPWDVATKDCAFFLDFDGTLADIAPQPDQVSVEPELLQTLQRLQTECGGAIAIISGRAIATIDHYLHPLKAAIRSEEHTSELQSRENLVCRLLLEKKKRM